MVRKYFILILSIYLIFLTLLSCEAEKKEQEKVIVKVGDEKLTLTMLKNLIPQNQKKLPVYDKIYNYIQNWIDNELMYQEAIRMGINESPELIEVLKKAKRDFLINQLLDSLLTKDSAISEQEIKNNYEMNKNNFMRAKPEIRALHILVSEESDAKAVRKRIRKGEDFEEVAKEVSLDYTRKNRIDMGYFSPDDIVPEIAASVFRYRVGSLTRPIKSEFGFHIFKILDKKKSNSLRDYDEVKDHIRGRLIAKKKEEKYKDFITGLKSKIDFKTNFEYLNELYSDSVNAAQNTTIHDSL